MSLINSFKVGSFLAKRTILRSNRYVTALIILILTLIFLNLVGVGGLLIGMVKSGDVAYYSIYSGAVVVNPLLEKKAVQRTDELVNFAKTLPGFVGYSPRLNASAKMELDWHDKKEGSQGNSISGSVLGLDPDLENQTTSLGTKVIEGRFLREDDRDSIVIGATLAGRGSGFSLGETLKGVEVGKKILLTYNNGVQKEYTIVGILSTKISIRSNQVFVNLQELKGVYDITDQRYSQIAIKTTDPLHPQPFKDFFVRAGYDQYNRIETWDETRGSALNNINIAFTLIGNVIGGIGLMVGGITIFILIFVNAITKRKFIGILKASGVSSISIVISYIAQAMIYTFTGVFLGLLFLYGFLVPYFEKNPIDFPFSDVTLYLTQDYVLVRIGILFLVSMIAGLVPAYLIARENSLNAIMGR